MYNRRRTKRTFPVDSAPQNNTSPDESAEKNDNVPPGSAPGRGRTLPVLPAPPAFRSRNRVSEIRGILGDELAEATIEPINWRLIKDFHPEFAKAMKAVVWSSYAIAEDTDYLMTGYPDTVCQLHVDLRLMLIEVLEKLKKVDPKRSEVNVLGKKMVIRWSIFIGIITGVIVALLPPPTMIWDWIGNLLF